MTAQPQIDPHSFLRASTTGWNCIDVRSEKEFRKAQLPNSVNLPILNTAERHVVGTEYRLLGKSSAVVRGNELVSGSLKEERIAAWLRVIDASPESVLICARGGLRSEISQKWLIERGVVIPRVSGGYKAVRALLLQKLPELSEHLSFVVVAGNTGSGKTALLRQLMRNRSVIDLESLANHRGSAFGGRGSQPAQSTFENELCYRLLQFEQGNKAPVFLESESRMIGCIWLPDCVQEVIRSSPVLYLDTPLEQRVEHIIQEYVLQPLGKLKDAYFENGVERLYLSLEESVFKIKKRLGSELAEEIRTDLREAFDKTALESVSGLSATPHRGWVAKLLTHYYDPLYDWQFSKQEREILARGSAEQLLAYAKTLSA